MNSDKENSINRMTVCFLGTVFIFIITFYAVLHVNSSDYEKHSLWARELSIGHLFRFMQNYVAYPLWHIVTKTFYKTFGFSLLWARATTTALFNCFAYWCVLGVWNSFSDSRLPAAAKSFWACCLLVVGPLYAPWFNNYYYLGQGTGNTWHNPSNIAVKGFCILCFCMIVRLLESQKTIKEDKRRYVLLSFLIFCSALAKPSFLQGMIPGLGLYFVIAVIINKGNREKIVKYFAIVATFIPAVLLLFYQLFFSFFADTKIHSGGSIGIGFGRVLHNWTPNLFISFILAFAFPIFILVLDFRNLIKKIPIQVALCYEFCAWAESALLYEAGERELDGNWLWGSYLSMFIVWMLFLFEYFNIISGDKAGAIKKNICLYGGSALLFSHVICGIFYWYSVTHP
ncbi:hypothetical protein C807_02248 [Lachnospiraceae bacterium 28-4]|nr:hypothetical protein C807_02248 [Lachnospiraceae bacterium 28-4]